MNVALTSGNDRSAIDNSYYQNLKKTKNLNSLISDIELKNDPSDEQIRNQRLKLYKEMISTIEDLCGSEFFQLNYLNNTVNIIWNIFYERGPVSARAPFIIIRIKPWKFRYSLNLIFIAL